MKILFLLRKNLIYGSQTSVIAKSGLLNSALITSSQLEKHLGVTTALEVCVDGNEVDKFLHKHKPKICIIEALWVTPVKMEELIKLHKKVTFIVLIHSEIPFLANEGNAIDWIFKYNELDRVYPAFNSEKTFRHFNLLSINDYYLPNIYLDVEKKQYIRRKHDRYLDIGCFGAIRPFKNQLLQAMAAIHFANTNKWLLRFHMNTSRNEQGGESVLKNIRALFDKSKHELREHGWMNRETFLCTVGAMDLGMQMSFTESFNIIAADFVHEGVPIVVSKTIDWMPESQQVDAEDVEGIVKALERSTIKRKDTAHKQVRYLKRYNERALDAWANFLRNYQH